MMCTSLWGSKSNLCGLHRNVLMLCQLVVGCPRMQSGHCATGLSRGCRTLGMSPFQCKVAACTAVGLLSLAGTPAMLLDSIYFPVLFLFL